MGTARLCGVEGCGKPYHARGMCNNHYQQWWISQNPERQRERRRKDYLAHREERLEQARNWTEAHPGVMRERAHKWRLANLERARECEHKYSLAHREERCENTRKWRLANPEKKQEIDRNWALANPERVRENIRKWKLANPERQRANERVQRARRRTRKANTFESLTTEDIAAIMAHGCFFSSLGDCYGPLCLAHDVPLSKGGNTTEANVFCLCHRHNSQMGTRLLSEMIEQLALGIS